MSEPKSSLFYKVNSSLTFYQKFYLVNGLILIGFLLLGYSWLDLYDRYLSLSLVQEEPPVRLNFIHKIYVLGAISVVFVVIGLLIGHYFIRIASDSIHKLEVSAKSLSDGKLHARAEVLLKNTMGSLGMGAPVSAAWSL